MLSLLLVSSSSCLVYFLKLKLNLPRISFGFLLGLLFYPEDEVDMFLQNTGLSPHFTVFHSRRHSSSDYNFNKISGRRESSLAGNSHL
jgi:hypothetical protein